MAYSRTEYHREVNRDDDRDNNKSGGWKSWFGLGDNKDRDEDRDRGYNYQATTTYRNDHPSSYGYSSSQRYPERTSGYSGAVSTGYSGARGGYGYTTSDEVNRGPSWNTDRDYTTRSSYGMPTGDRDVYYKQETRTYGGDRSYTPTRSYGYSGEHRDTGYNTTRDYTTRDYTPSRQTMSYERDYKPSQSYGFSGDRDRDYNYSRTYTTTGGDRDYGYNTNRNTTNWTSSGSGGYGDSTYTRPSYQQSSYRY